MFDQAIHNLQSWSGLFIIPALIIFAVLWLGVFRMYHPTTMIMVILWCIVMNSICGVSVLVPLVFRSPFPKATPTIGIESSAGAARAMPTLSRDEQVHAAQTRWAK